MMEKFKNLLRWFKSSYKTLLIIAIVLFLVFIIVNMFSYDTSIYSISFSNLSKINLSWQAKKEGIELYFSILTIIGLIIAIYQFISSNKQAETANRQLNASILQTNLTSQNTNSLLKQTQISIQQLEKINKLVVTSNQQLNLSIQQKRTEDELLMKSVVNGLLEALRHNINLVEELFFEYDKGTLYKFIKSILDKPNFVYYPIFDCYNKEPSPIPDLLKKYKKNYTVISKTNHQRLIKLRDDSISFAIKYNKFLIKNHSRIFLNLGHLLWAIDCYNFALDKYNAIIEVYDLPPKILTLEIYNEAQYRKLQLKASWNVLKRNYFIRLHYRLYFMLIDIVTSFDENVFLDKEYVRSIKKMIEENDR